MADEEASPPPPDGFVLSARRGGFSRHIGPYFVSEAGAHAFFALHRHCNGLGLLHGGMLSSFLDNVLAFKAVRETGATAITMHLSLDFIDMGRAGDWVLGEASLTRATRDVAFVEGRAHINGRVLARAMGVFKLMRRPIR